MSIWGHMVYLGECPQRKPVRELGDEDRKGEAKQGVTSGDAAALSLMGSGA